MKRVIGTIGIAACGLGLIITGFAYDVLFAGIPYQDPTPELQATWEFHKGVADLFYRTGGLVFLVGLVAMPMIWIRLRKPAPPGTSETGYDR